MSAGRRVLEKEVRFSHSLLWKAQRQYFDEKGVEAWSGTVPFFITSNPFIAKRYAEVLIRWVQDLLQHHQADPHAPFYVVELGTGSGRFSFMTMRYLFELQKALSLKAKIIYVMTDFTASNLSFWQEHEKLKPFVDQGLLDFAIYDLEEDLSLKLEVSGQILKSGEVKNPIAVLGNYIFDTVSDDAFYVKDGQLFESLISVEAEEENVQEGMPLSLENLNCRFTRYPIAVDYYDNPLWNEILSLYAKTLKNGSFLFPLGGLKSLEVFRSLSGGKMLLIATDKGYSFLHEMEGKEDSKLVFHGSFSMTVNFHAIGEYFKILKGDVALQNERDSIKTCTYTMGVSLETLPETKQAIQSGFQNFGPGDYFSLHRNIREMKDPAISLTTLLAQLALSGWDPYVLSCFIPRVLAELPKASKLLQIAFAKAADEIKANIYLMPGVEDYYFNVGLLYHNGGRYPEAIECYQQSLASHGEKFSSYYNLGLCSYFHKDLQGALEYFKKAIPFDTERRAKEWMNKVSSELNSA